MNPDTFLKDVLNALMDVYAVGNVHAPFTRVNKAMLDAGLTHSLYLRLSKLTDEMVTEDNVVWQQPCDSPIFVDTWFKDNRYINGSVRTCGLVLTFHDFDLFSFDDLDSVTDPEPFKSHVSVKGVETLQAPH